MKSQGVTLKFNPNAAVQCLENVAAPISTYVMANMDAAYDAYSV